jgi:hypothetical protein
VISHGSVFDGSGGSGAAPQKLLEVSFRDLKRFEQLIFIIADVAEDLSNRSIPR